LLARFFFQFQSADAAIGLLRLAVAMTWPLSSPRTFGTALSSSSFSRHVFLPASGLTGTVALGSFVIS
jgi:hypothetical protein